MMREEVKKYVDMYIPGHLVTEEEQLEKLFAALETWVQIPDEVLPENIHAVRKDELSRKLTELVVNHYEERGRTTRSAISRESRPWNSHYPRS